MDRGNWWDGGSGGTGNRFQVFQLRDRVETPNGAGLVVQVFIEDDAIWYAVDHPSLEDGYQHNYRSWQMKLIPE